MHALIQAGMSGKCGCLLTDRPDKSPTTFIAASLQPDYRILARQWRMHMYSHVCSVRNVYAE
jgi:hypothetical protein